MCDFPDPAFAIIYLSGVATLFLAVMFLAGLLAGRNMMLSKYRPVIEEYEREQMVRHAMMTGPHVD